MNYWLLKSEPDSWSWADQCARKDQGEWWDGVRNYQASNNMRAMKKYDRAFFYHSGKNPHIVGIVEVIHEAKLDPSDPKQKFYMVCVRALQSLPNLVSLQALKENVPTLSILRQSRLSVAPIQKEEWEQIKRLGERS